MNKKSLTETDIRTKFITPALVQAGWDIHKQVREEFSFTKGRIIVRGKLHTRGESRRADFILYHKPNLPLAIIECKAGHHRLEEALAQLDGYQRSFAAQFVFNQVCVGLNRRQGLYGAILTKPAFYARYRLEAPELAEVAARLGSEPGEQEQLLWALFEPGRFLELVAHFVLFETRDGKTVKKLPRYQQWRAVRKTVRRLTSGANDEPTLTSRCTW